MNRFDELLEKLPRVLEKGLSDFKFSKEMRAQVRMRLNRGVCEKPNRFRKFALAVVPAAMFVFCLVGAVAGIRWWIGRSDPAARQTAVGPYFTEIEAIDIDLDGEEPLELVNTWRIREPDYGDTLMAMIWTRDSRGQLNVASTHPFEGSKFFPLLILSPVTEKANYVLIASTDEANRIYFCVLGYDGNEVFNYRQMSTTTYSNDSWQQLQQQVKYLFPASFEIYKK